VIVLGGGPNRIGQGIEFDYCCVHAAFALRELGYETVMVNSNPETVSTDFDTSDMLFFEPLTHEDVMNVVDRIEAARRDRAVRRPDAAEPRAGLKDHGAPLVGTSVDSIDEAEDRELFSKLITEARHRPAAERHGRERRARRRRRGAHRLPGARAPVFVLGGRAMEIVYDRAGLDFVRERHASLPKTPMLVDKFLDSAIEVDVDAIADGENVIIGGVMEHIEEAGIHSGDSSLRAAAVHALRRPDRADLRDHTRRAREGARREGPDERAVRVAKGPKSSTSSRSTRARRAPCRSSARRSASRSRSSPRSLMLGETLAEVGITREALRRRTSR
jgi:carbamoyl-phosphate synthase large subunit